MANIAWTDELIISEIKRLSKNGFCPRPTKHPKLYTAAYKRKGWRYYCDLAGVKTYRAPGQPKQKAKARPKLDENTDRMKLFCAVISMAIETGREVDVLQCMEAVRRGDADCIRII